MTDSRSTPGTASAAERILEDQNAWRFVRVVRRAALSTDVLGLTLAAVDGTPLPDWQPGAHIDLELDGRLERHYSLCGTMGDGRWTVAILNEPNSRGGSAWVHAHASEGHELRARGPRNNFPLVAADMYLLVAGGVGITPIISMVRALQHEGRPWKLLYGGRQLQSMAFLDELATFGERVQVWPQETHGQLQLKEFLGTPAKETAVYCCGPEGLLGAVEALAATWPADVLHIERFRPRADAGAGPDRGFELELARSGVSVTVAPGESMVDAAARVGVFINTSCGEGTCGTCVCKVLEGAPDHRDVFLNARQRAENKTVTPCCSRALTPRIVLDA